MLAVVQHVWKEGGQALCDKPKDVLSVGQVSQSVHVLFFFGVIVCTLTKGCITVNNTSAA